MSDKLELADYLARWAGRNSARAAVAETIIAIAAACRTIADLIAAGPLAGDLAAPLGEGGGGDMQKALDVRANEILISTLRHAPVAAVASEELPAPVTLSRNGPIVVAIDPLDGSSNIDTNLSIGTIFSILPMTSAPNDPLNAFLQPGRQQLGAGYVLYGTHTALVLTLGEGVDMFTLNPACRKFLLTRQGLKIPAHTSEFAINASNYRHWDVAVQNWYDDCIAGANGPREADFNMRWLASMAAEAHRILMRGGVYFYPGDTRPGYGNGRLRLVYEANPVGLIIEQADGAASTGTGPVLDRMPTSLHGRVPLLFGSSEEVARLERYHFGSPTAAERSPLFGRRGLFRI